MSDPVREICGQPGTPEQPLGKVPLQERSAGTGADGYAYRHLNCNTTRRLLHGVEAGPRDETSGPRAVLILTQRDARFLVQALAAFDKAADWPELGGPEARQRLQQALAIIGYPE